MLRTRRFYKNNSGSLEGLPLKMIIIVIIMAITIPLIFLGLMSYDKGQTESNVKNEVEKIVTTIKQCINGANGTKLPLDVSLNNGMFADFEYVKIGDSMDGKYRFSIRYKLSNEDEVVRLIGKDTLVTNENGDGAVHLGPGSYKLSFTHIVTSEQSYVSVKVV